MQSYRCDWCGCEKGSEEGWVAGLAAERVGVTARRREVSLAEGWSEELARHPLSVHFCCAEHANHYIDRLIFTGAGEANTLEAKKNRTGGRSRQRAVAVATPDRKKALKTGISRTREKRTPGFNRDDKVRAHALGIRL